MEKKQCPECGKINENSSYCLECGFRFENNKVITKSNEYEKVNLSKEKNIKVKDYSQFIILTLSILYLIGLYKLPIIISRNSGNLSIFEFVKQYSYITNIYSLYKYGSIFVNIVLILNMILIFGNKITKILSKIFYLLTFLFEIFFILIVLFVINYKIILLNTFILFVIPLIIFIIFKINNNTNIKIKNKKSDNYIDKINELKKLYDNKAISKEEFEKYKKIILDKELNI